MKQTVKINNKDKKKKKIYSKPTIHKYGTVSALTKGVGGSVPDMGSRADTTKIGRG